MLFGLLDDPASFLRSLLILLPGALFSISLHEAAHGYIAEKCGDPTARYAGRITLNPAKHFDPLGFLCMFLIGFGWAKPVPVNPLLYKKWRRDDIKVSLAGITANLIVCLACAIITTVVLNLAIHKLPVAGDSLKDMASSSAFIYEIAGETRIVVPEEGYYLLSDTVFYFAFMGANSVVTPVITAAFGSIGAILFEMLTRCMTLNIALAVFNLIPIPPLDGYHVLNDLVLKQDAIGTMRFRRIAGYVFIALLLLGNFIPQLDIISSFIGRVEMFILGNLANFFHWISTVIGVI